MVKDKTVTLAHGAGGTQTAELIDQVFKAHFGNPDFTADDAAVLSVEAGRLAFTTDGFIVSPWEFPGGNIGKLSICGTVNDLSCMTLVAAGYCATYISAATPARPAPMPKVMRMVEFTFMPISVAACLSSDTALMPLGV